LGQTDNGLVQREYSKRICHVRSYINHPRAINPQYELDGSNNGSNFGIDQTVLDNLGTRPGLTPRHCRPADHWRSLCAIDKIEARQSPIHLRRLSSELRPRRHQQPRCRCPLSTYPRRDPLELTSVRDCVHLAESCKRHNGSGVLNPQPDGVRHVQRLCTAQHEQRAGPRCIAAHVQHRACDAAVLGLIRLRGGSSSKQRPCARSLDGAHPAYRSRQPRRH
jgi:hypothetical protein